MLSIVAVVITYHPDLAVLLRLLRNLEGQVKEIVVVDNGSGLDLAGWCASAGVANVHVRLLGENRGIAAAQNIGVAYAKSRQASHVVLFDHDSLPALDMVARLVACEQALLAEGWRVASIGACYRDERQENPPPFVRVVGGRLQRCSRPELVGEAVRVDYTIASGALIPLPVIDAVGGMNEGLFIDYVDIEWGLRARAHGYENFGCFSALMAHSLGDEPIFFLGKAYPSHSPLRHYYFFRNELLLYRMRHIPRAWKWCNWRRGLLRLGFYLLFARPRVQQLKMIFLGLLHGAMGRTGKLGA